MKILQINACHYRRGGSEIVYFNTAQLLKSHGHTISYFSTKDSRNELSEFDKYFVPNENIRDVSFIKKIQRSPSYLYNSRAGKSLEQLIIDFKPDVAHIHIFYGALSVSILKVLKKHKIPVVHTSHDYRLLCPVNTFMDKDGNMCELCMDKHFIHCIKKRCSEGKLAQSTMVMLEAYFWKYFTNPVDYIDHFIFVSEFSQNKHIQFNRGYEGKYSKIYNFTDINSTGNLASKGDYFLFFGRLSVEKGINTLLSGFSSRKDQKLIIAGTGPLKNYVEDFISENKNIEYVGFKTGKDLELLIRNASFIVVPSEWYENNPMTIIEAFCLGKPVIGANIGGIPELIKQGINGYVFESGNKQSLESAIDKASAIDKEQYEELSKAAYEFALNNFEKESHYLKLLKIYNDVINKGCTKQIH